MRKLTILIATAISGLLLATGGISSDQTATSNGENADPLQFARDVEPILSRHCLTCHGEREPEGGLRLTSRRNALNRNDSGEPALVVGQADQSELIRRITAGIDERMPPEGEPLSSEEIETLRRWIDEGARWPETESGPQHWAYLAPRRPEPPPVQRPEWVQNEIDAFVLSRLEHLDPPLSPSPPADPATLLRRVSLDLIGLPPSVDELDAFLADPSPTHYQEIVDRLLQSPRFGEKWARQWLDLARYADSNGYQADQFRSVWAWRDWVVQALNDDMPFDQFTIEQLAGDLLPDASPQQQIATGFHRCTTCNVEAGVDPEENRVNQIIDRVNTTGTVWLGTSLECAQCHNHKYDPFTQQDYYQLFAYFNNTPLEVVLEGGKGVQYEVAGPEMELPLADSLQQQRESLQARENDLQEKVADRRRVLQGERPEWEARLRSRLEVAPEWQVLAISAFESTGGATSREQDDQSLLVTGPAPTQDTYVITIAGPIDDVTGLKLECLTDDSLPKRGPGRGTPNPNLILNELTATLTPDSESAPQPVLLHTPRADFSQKNWDVAGILDGDPQTGWGINPQFGQSHWISVLTAEPINIRAGGQLRLQLMQNYGGARTIGRLRLSAMTGPPGADTIPEDVRQILRASSGPLSKADRQVLGRFHEQDDPTLSQWKRELDHIKGQLDEISPETTLVMVEMESPRMSAIFKRGNFLDVGATVSPRLPTAFAGLIGDSAGDRSQDRLGLAQWLVSADNPLVARVTVNRWWSEIFGQGIVRTVEDFGTQGEPPSHPALLDWLAVEFLEHDWSLKHMLRLIVTSATYQQDSRITTETWQRDPANQWLARGARVRLPAEAIRDNALAISGLLSTKVGGPPVYPPQPPRIWRHVGRNAPKYVPDEDEDRYRRGIYVVWRRSAPYPSFTTFDAPDRGASCARRSRTNTPLQALTLLNDPAYVEMALALARRLERDHEQMSDREKIEYGFRLCVARQPGSEEVSQVLELFNEQRERFSAAPDAAAELTGLKSSEGEQLSRLAAWLCVANTLLNLDETITRN